MAPTPNDIADDHSLLKNDQELDFLMEQIEDEIEESGEASKEAMDRLQMFCQAMNVKVDRIGAAHQERTVRLSAKIVLAKIGRSSLLKHSLVVLKR